MFSASKKNRVSVARKSRQPSSRGVEMMESRTLFSGGLVSLSIPAAAQTSTTAGVQINLSVLGADTLSQSLLSYTWAVTSAPTGSLVNFLTNNSNSASNTTATFTKAGNYVVTSTITDILGLTSITSSAPFTVTQADTNVLVNSALSTLPLNGSTSLTALVKDQFGDPMNPQPSVTWSTDAGSISTSGVYTAPGTGATPLVTATVNGVLGDASLSVINTAPVITASASAQLSTNSPNTAALSVGATDDGGAANVSYTWSTLSAPTGATVSLNLNGSTAAKNALATLSTVGNYVLQVAATDSLGLSTLSTVNLVVAPQLTSLTLTPGTTSILGGAKQTLTCLAFDQFGKPMALPSNLSFSLDSGSVGYCGSNGVYIAPVVGGGNATCRASAVVNGVTVTTTATLRVIKPTGKVVAALPLSIVNTAAGTVHLCLTPSIAASLSAKGVVHILGGHAGWKAVGTITAGTNVCVISGLQAGKTYHFVVTAGLNLTAKLKTNVAAFTMPKLISSALTVSNALVG